MGSLMESSRMTLTRLIGLALLLLLAAVGAMNDDARGQGAAAAPAESRAAAGEGEQRPRRLILRFLTEGEFPPFNFRDEEGVLTGLNVDLANAICLEMAAACDIQIKPWEELLPALARGEADAVIAGHSVTARALAQVDFTDRYFHTPGRFVGRKGGARLEITPSGLEGKRIAVARRTSHEAYLTAFFKLSQIVPFESPELAREAVAQGQADVLFDDGVSLAFWLLGAASKECCEFKGGPFMEPKFFGSGMAIAVPKGDVDLREQLNQMLRRVRSSGRFEELVTRYFPLRVY
jgi:polar amino acid transport system substrate-binding protein